MNILFCINWRPNPSRSVRYALRLFTKGHVFHCSSFLVLRWVEVLADLYRIDEVFTICKNFLLFLSCHTSLITVCIWLAIFQGFFTRIHTSIDFIVVVEKFQVCSVRADPLTAISVESVIEELNIVFTRIKIKICAVHCWDENSFTFRSDLLEDHAQELICPFRSVRVSFDLYCQRWIMSRDVVELGVLCPWKI